MALDARRSNAQARGVILSKVELRRFLAAKQATPHDTLGMHVHLAGRGKGVVVRALLRNAVECSVVDPASGESWPMDRLAPEGFFEALIPGRLEVFAYELRITASDGAVRQMRDPYSFLPTLGDQDLYLFNEGNEHRIYDKLGAHLRTIGRRVRRGVRGLGAHRRPGLRRRQFQFLGRPLSSHALARRLGGLGAFRARFGRG